MPLEKIQSAYRQRFALPPDASLEVAPIKKGASGRTIVRVKGEGAPPIIGIHYTDARQDNALHKPVSDFLEEHGVRVPPILLADLDTQILLVQDVGKTDLLSLKEADWSAREPYYRETFRQLALLAKSLPTAEVEMMPPFTEDTYRWEQEYFAEHFIGTHLGKDAKAVLDSPLLRDLASDLGSQQPDLCHRDFQSQNLMLQGEEVFVIDFQGARLGYSEYDLASFIYDPYMRHPLEEREKLRALWEEESGRALDRDFMRKCALQRIMQALGAYGNIVHNQKNEWYAQHITPATEMLLSLTADTEYESLYHPLLTKNK